MCVNPIGAKRLGYPQKVLLDLGTQPYARLQRGGGGGGSWRKALKKMRKRKKMRKKKKMPLPTTLEAEGS